MKKIILYFFGILLPAVVHGQEADVVREHILMDKNWTFALGHAHDVNKDFGHSTAHFTHWAKTGYGDGPASQYFDDRAWRQLDIPHDWCVELPFSPKGTKSHGYKAIGHHFPENSIGWYRKRFFIPGSDEGRKIKIQFDGVHRNSSVFVNGFYVGTEKSGYASFEYDITDYLNFGAENVLAVRVDASVEEGWFYEGAGIYRHVWLNKMAPLHVGRYGTFITTELEGKKAKLLARTTVENESVETKTFEIEEKIVTPSGQVVAESHQKGLAMEPLSEKRIMSSFVVENPQLWSLDSPDLHTLVTTIKADGKILDQYQTTFGIRTVRFDADEGFFLNGQSVKIKGVCNHQDHAGVGTAIPDALQEWRVQQIKKMGANAIRTSHNPPTPELLNICDRLGIMIMDENRLMGSSQEHLGWLKNLIKRDRNHPSVIIWSLGNEEWYIEGSQKGRRIHTTMEHFAMKLDSSRAFTTASSGGWDYGIGTVSQVMGYNYLSHGDIDAHHRKFPDQPSIGTEESNIKGTRGIYQTDEAKKYLAPTNKFEEEAEKGWTFYAERPFLSGLFYWTGFDYRGEPTPFEEFPAVTSQFGIHDLCGFPKGVFYYYQSWWQKEPVLHIQPHWNLKNKKGEDVQVVVYSNCEEVELWVNKKNWGKKKMPMNGHLEWTVPYEPGQVQAIGFAKGKKVLTKTIHTTGLSAKVQLDADRTKLTADGRDVAVVSVQVQDEIARMVPDAVNEVTFNLEGPGKIIGVGNGNPSSLEPDRFFESIHRIPIMNLRELSVRVLENRSETAKQYDDHNWIKAFSEEPADWTDYRDSFLVIRGDFELPEITSKTIVRLFTKSITENMSLYINGQLIRANIQRDAPNQSFELPHDLIRQGKNSYAVTGMRFKKKHQWEELNRDPGLVQVIYPATTWKRKVFNGLAQVLIQSTEEEGVIILRARSKGIEGGVVKIETKLP